MIGAAGGLGHYAVQILRTFGFHVVGVDVGEERLEFVRSLGADRVVSPDEAVEVTLAESAVSTPCSCSPPASRASSSASRC